jgi:hypothetical protein
MHGPIQTRETVPLRDCYLIERTRFLKRVTGRIFKTIDFTKASKSFIYNFLRKKAVENEKTNIVLRKSTGLNFRTFKKFFISLLYPFQGTWLRDRIQIFDKNE